MKKVEMLCKYDHELCKSTQVIHKNMGKPKPIINKNKETT